MSDYGIWTEEQFSKAMVQYYTDHPEKLRLLPEESQQKVINWGWQGMNPEPLWAPAEQVPFTERASAGVPLSSAAFSAGGATGGQTVVRNDATAASGIGPLLLILLAFWLMG